jgi:hypothetical protein
LFPATRFDAACPYTSLVPLHNYKVLVGLHSGEAVTWYWLLCNLMIISGSDFHEVSQKHELLFIFSLLKHQLKSNEKMILTMELQQLVQRQVLWCNVKNTM